MDDMAGGAGPLVGKLSDFPWRGAGIWACDRSLCELFCCTVSGSEIGFFRRAPTGD